MSNKATRILGSGGSFVFDPVTGQTVAVGSTTPGTRSIAFDSTINAYAALSGGLTVYAVNNSVGGQEPWVTDGTTAGTHLLAALAPGQSSAYSMTVQVTTTVTVTGSFATNFASLDATRALFTALDPTGVRRLWITNGSAAGTAAVSADVIPDLQEPIVALGDGRALFQGFDGRGNELWVTDGTASGTRLVEDISAGQGAGSAAGVPNSSNPNGFVALGGGRAMFAAFDGRGNGLWITDGTATNTRKFIALDSPHLLSLLGNGLVIFENGSQPWITDGTTAGTRLLSLLTPVPSEGTRNLPVSGFGVLRDGRAVFFIDRDIGLRFGDAGQRLLYVTDGTEAGTTLIKDFGGNGASIAQSSFLQLADGRVSFSAGLGGTGLVQVWVSDGTSAGTQAVTAVAPGGYIGGLSGSALVDAPFYYAHYTDVAGAAVAAAAHYDASGWHEGRDPSALFSTTGYLNAYADVKGAGIDPLQHYDQVGWKEGRDPSAAFDTRLYLTFNPDVAAAGIDPLAHYLAAGQVEGRKSSAVVDSAVVRDGFDGTYYKLSNPDVAAAGVDPLMHFLSAGAAEGRNPDAFFDTSAYLRNNPDVAASGINPLAHYINVGWTEGRDPSSHFSTKAYLAAYGDVRAAGVNPLVHFLQSGIVEGRSAFADRL